MNTIFDGSRTEWTIMKKSYKSSFFFFKKKNKNISSYIFKYYHVFMYLQCPRGTVAVIYGFIVSPNNLYKGLNMAPRHDADDKSNPKSSAID